MIKDKADKTTAKKTPINNPGNRRGLLFLGISIAGLIVLLVILELLKRNTAISEWITVNISRRIVWVMGHITFILPFSLFEILVITAIIVLIVWLAKSVKLLINKRFWTVLRSLCVVLVIVLSAVNFYTLSAGFAYYRGPVPIPMSQTLYRDDDVAAIADYFVQDFIAVESRLERDSNGDIKPPYSKSEMIKRIRIEMNKLDNDYFFRFSPRPKGIINSWFMSDTGITGIAFLPTGEPNYNRNTPKSFLPQVIAHEIAHTKGVMKEREANLVSYYVLINSDDDYLRYCGYFAVIDDMYTAVIIGNNYKRDKADSVFEQVPDRINAEKSRAYKYWRDYSGPITFLSDVLSKAGEFFNDLYLKINGAEDGTDSYINPWDLIDTGEVDPDTQEKIYDPIYSNVHKMFFDIYENKANQNI